MFCFLLISSVWVRASQYTDAAIEGMNWVIDQGISTPDGMYWPNSVIGQDKHIDYNRTFDLYSGIAGVCIGMLETHRATGQSSSQYLDTAIEGANYMVAKLDTQIQQKFDPNLYHGGMAGVAYALWEMYKATGDKSYSDGAQQTLDYVLSCAMPQPGGGTTYDEMTSLRWGDAGIGFTFLYFYSDPTFPQPSTNLLQAAADIGTYIINEGVPANGGLKWYVYGKSGYEYPNYAEGTSGNCYYLATLYHFNQDDTFLNAALQGATYLLSIANTANGGCMVYHDASNKNFYYLGECNGPSGTARFFLRLYQVTGDSSYFTWAERSVLSIQQHAPISSSGDKYNWAYNTNSATAIWRNYGQCDGAAAGAEANLLMGQTDSVNASTSLQFSMDVADDIISHATTVETAFGQGMFIITQEWRTDASTYHPQVGYMQGSAGIGSVFYGIDYALGNIQDVRIALPDSPWAFGFCCPNSTSLLPPSSAHKLVPATHKIVIA